MDGGVEARVVQAIRGRIQAILEGITGVIHPI
jgi:hypothetical protein